MSSTILGIIASGGAAAAGATSFESISTNTPVAGSTSVILNSIPGTFKHLQVRYLMRRNAAGSCQVYLRPNSDATANKAYHYLRATASAVSGNGAASNSRIYLGEATSSTQTSGNFAVGIVDIYDYANTSKYKTVRSLNGYDQQGAGYIHHSSGLWQSTSAITSLEFEFAGDATETGATFALYGIKESA